MAKKYIGTDPLDKSFVVSRTYPIDDRFSVENYLDLFQKSTWATTSSANVYSGLVTAVLNGEERGLWVLFGDSASKYKYLYDPSASSDTPPVPSSGSVVEEPGVSPTMGWRKLSFGSDFEFPDEEGDYILVIDDQGNARFTKDKRLVPTPGTNDVAGMILTVTDDGNGELSYGWEPFWLPKPTNAQSGDLVLRKDPTDGSLSWVPASGSGSAEDTIGINVEGIYEDDGNAGIQPKSGASTTRKETLANTGAVVAVEEGQAAGGKFRLEIPIINGGDAWGNPSSGTQPAPTPTPAFNPAAVTIMIDGTAIETLGTSDNVIPASMSGIYIPTPYVPAGSAIRYSENFNIIPGSTTQIDTGNDVSSTCQVMIWAGGTWIDCFECEQDLLTGVWDVEQKDSGTDVIAPDLACIILS